MTLGSTAFMTILYMHLYNKRSRLLKRACRLACKIADWIAESICHLARFLDLGSALRGYIRHPQQWPDLGSLRAEVDTGFVQPNQYR